MAASEENRSNTMEKPRNASVANRIIFRSGYFVQERVFCRARITFLPVVRKCNLLKADKGDHAPDEAVTLGHLRDDVGNSSGHQPEISGINRDQDIARTL